MRPFAAKVPWAVWSGESGGKEHGVSHTVAREGLGVCDTTIYAAFAGGL